MVSSVFFASFVGSSFLTSLVRKFSMQWGLMDIPADRKVHTKPIPRSGGLAIIATFILVNLFFHSSALEVIWPLLFGAALVAALGFIDDRNGMPALFKFVGQVAIAIVTVLIFDISIQLFPNLAINKLLSVFWIVGIMNAMNLLDNMDGLTTGISVIASVFLLFFAVQAFQLPYAIVAISIIGCCLGFLLFNFKPASIFMGDMGSMSLGYLLAVLGITIRIPTDMTIIQLVSNQFSVPVSSIQYLTALVPLLILALPLFDTTLVTVFRRLNGRSIAHGGKDHTSHRLVALNLTERTAVLVLYFVACCSGLCAIAITYGNIYLSIFALGLLVIALILSVYKLASARVYIINRRLRNKLKKLHDNER